MGRLLTNQQITDGQTYQTSYQYDAFGKLLTETYPSGRTVKTDYNQDGDVSSILETVEKKIRLCANANQDWKIKYQNQINGQMCGWAEKV